MKLRSILTAAIAVLWSTKIFATSLSFAPQELTWIDSSTLQSGSLFLSLGTADAKKRITFDLGPDLANDIYYLTTLKSCETYALWVKTVKQGSLAVYVFPDAVKADDGQSGTLYARISSKSRLTIQCTITN